MTTGASIPIQDVIESELRERILLGDIEPGGRINVRRLEQHFGVSHIPIREAIRRLEAEGLVVNVPKRGAVAAGVSLNERHLHLTGDALRHQLHQQGLQ
jgi:DNA-binding GntR family transcriptional regulator